MNNSPAESAARFEFRRLIGGGRVNDRAMAARAALFTLVFFLQAPVPLFANGGAFDTSVVERTGNLVPTEKPLISLEEETLNA